MMEHSSLQPRMTHSKRDSLESFYIRTSTEIASQARLEAIPDVIDGLLSAVEEDPSEMEVVNALNNASNLARGSADVRSNLRDTRASKLIAAILNKNTESVPICEASLQAICLLIRDTHNASYQSVLENIDTFGTLEASSDLVNVMEEHTSSASIVVGVLIAIHAIAHNEEKRKLFSTLGACETVIDAIQTHSDSSEVQLLGLKAILALITDYTDNKNHFINGGGAELIELIAREHMDDIILLENTLWIILHLSSNNNEMKTILGEAGICDRVVNIVTVYNDKRLHCDIGCQCIANLSTNHEANKMKFFTINTCELLNSILIKYPTIPTIVYHVMAAITSLCTRSAQLKTRFGNMGICEKVLETGERFCKDSAIASGCCRAIAALSGVEVNKVRFFHVFPLITELMREFPTDAVVAESACLVVSFLHGLLNNPEEFSIVAKELNGVMMRHANNPYVMEHVLRALVNLSSYGRHADMLVTMGVCANIAIILKKHQEVEVIAREGMKAVLNLCLASEDNCIKLNEVNISDGIVRCIKTHSRSQVTTDVSCQLLTVMILNYEDLFVSSMGNAGVGGAVVEILNQHKVSSIVAPSFQIVATLGRHELLASQMIKLKIIDSIVSSTRMNIEEISVVDNAVSAIASLSYHQQDDRVIMGESDVCSLLVEIMELHAEKQLIAEHCCCSVRNLSDIQNNVVKFSQSIKCCQYLTKILRHHSNVSILVPQCAAAIAGLTFDNETNISRFGDLGACELLIQALHKFPHDTFLVDSVLLAMVNLSAKQENGSRFMEGHICPEVIEVTKPRIDNPGVSEQALKIFLNLALVGEQNIAQLGTAGVCEYVQTALNNHEAEEGVASLSLKIIIVLCQNNDSNAARFVCADMCSRVVTCMRMYVERNRLSDLVCRVVVAITTNDTRQARFGAAGACEAIMDMIRRHMAHGKVIGECCKALYALAHDHEENAAKMDLAGVAPLLNRVLVKYAENPIMSAFCLNAIEAVAIDEKVSSSFATSGACDLIHIIFDRHREHVSLCEQVCKTVTRMISSVDSNANRFSTCRMENSVTDIFIRHISSASYIIAANHMIIMMCMKNAVSVSKFVQSGLCDLFPDIINQYVENKIVITCTFNVILSILVEEDQIHLAYTRGICERVSEAIEKNINDQSAADSGIQVITSLCQSSEECCHRLVELNICAKIVEAINLHITPSHIENDGYGMLSEICTLIELLSVTVSASKGDFGVYGIDQAMMDLLSEISDHPEVTALCFRIVAAVCKENGTNASAFGAGGICELLCEDMVRFNDDNEVSETCCNMAAQLLSQETNLNKLVSLQVAQLLINICKTHSDNSTICEIAFKCIMLIPSEKDSFLCDNGASEVLSTALDVMNRHSTEVSIVEVSLKLLCYLIAVDSNRKTIAKSIESGTSVVSEGTFRIAVKHTDSAEVWDSMMTMIFTLSETSELTKHWHTLGATDQIVEALKKHTKHAKLCISAYEAVLHLSSNKNASTKFLQIGLCENILGAMKTHINTELNTETALETLCALVVSSDGTAYITKLGSTGACELLTQILKIHVKREKIASACCKLFFYLCGSNDPNRVKAGGACDDVVFALKRHQKSVFVVENGCRAIAVLSQNEVNRTRLGRNACIQIVDAMKSHYDHAIVAEYSCLAATRLTVKNDDNKATLHECGVNRRILAIIERHKTDKNVRERATEAIQIFIEK